MDKICNSEMCLHMFVLHIFVLHIFENVFTRTFFLCVEKSQLVGSIVK